MKVVAAVSMWDVCVEKGHRDLEQFEKVHRYISDQLFTNFVSDFSAHFSCIGPFPRVLSGDQPNFRGQRKTQKFNLVSLLITDQKKTTKGLMILKGIFQHS